MQKKKKNPHYTKSEEIWEGLPEEWRQEKGRERTEGTGRTLQPDT